MSECLSLRVYAQCVMQSVWSVTFPPGHGRFWSSARLAGKQGCVPISYCLVRQRECKCWGRTWNTGREHERKEDREVATERRERMKLNGKEKTEEWKKKGWQCWSTHKCFLFDQWRLYSLPSATCVCINVEGGGVVAPWRHLIIMLTKQNVTLLRQMWPYVQTSAADTHDKPSATTSSTQGMWFSKES